MKTTIGQDAADTKAGMTLAELRAFLERADRLGLPTVHMDMPQLEALRDELRALIREAHGVTKDLQHAVRDAKDATATGVAETMAAEVQRQVAQLGEATEKAMREAVAKVGREFDRLEAILTGTDRESRRAGKPPLEDLLREIREATPARRKDPR